MISGYVELYLVNVNPDATRAHLSSYLCFIIQISTYIIPIRCFFVG